MDYDASNKDMSEESLLREMLPDRPNEKYVDLRSRVLAVRSKFYERMGELLSPAINTELQRFPYGTYEEKKELIRWLNGELRAFGIAIDCPKTHKPVTMYASPGHHTDKGTFVFRDASCNHTGRQSSTHYSVTLPPLKLTPNFRTLGDGREPQAENPSRSR